MKTVPSLRHSKAELRKEIRRRRSALSPARRAGLDAAINLHLLKLADETRPGAVAAFHAFDGEPDLLPALAELQRRGIRLALPIVHPEPGRAALTFREWVAGCDMRPNRFGIQEPWGTAEVRVEDVDLALIPLVAWDETGGRLGMGASFYDRLFQPFAQQRHPLRIGVAYRVQQLDRVPMEPWDVRLHRVVTDDGCIDCTAPPAADSPAHV